MLAACKRWHNSKHLPDYTEQCSKHGASKACLEHEAYSALQALVLAQGLDALKVGIHVHLGTGVVQLAAHCAHEFGEALQVLLLGSSHICQQLLDALMHDLLCQHLLAVQEANELDVAQCSSPCLHVGAKVVRVTVQ